MRVAQSCRGATGGFAETGSPLALTGPSDAYGRVEGWVGLKGATTIDLGGGSTLLLSAYGRAVALGGDREIDLPVNFVGDTTALAIDGGRTGTFGADLGTAAAWRVAANANAYIAYDARLRDRFTAQTASAGIKIAF